MSEAASSHRTRGSLRSTQATCYPGRYHDDTLSDYIDIKEQERAGIQPVSSPSTTNNPRAPSFAQQEELLKSIARVKREGRSK